MQRVKYLRFLLLLIFMISCMCVGAQDTVKKIKYHKIHRSEFVEKYAVNDTAKAVVNLFYRKRATGLISVLSIPESLLLTAGGFGIDMLIWGNAEGMFAPKVATVIFLFTFPVAIPATVVGIVQRTRYTKKKLFHTLEGYEKDRILNDRIKYRLNEYDFRKIKSKS